MSPDAFRRGAGSLCSADAPTDIFHAAAGAQIQLGAGAQGFKVDQPVGPPTRRRILTAGLILGATAALIGLPRGAIAADPLKLVVVGDSLTAGLGVEPAKAFPNQLEARLRAEGLAVEVVNAGVSGDTTAAGLERLDWAVPVDADAVIVELGANDALRGIAPAETARNMEAIVARLAASGRPVLVAGMRAPANWGAEYQARFDHIFADVAQRHGALLMPFFLDGVAMQPALNQADGIHPNAQGVSVIVDTILPFVRDLLARAGAWRAAAGRG